MDEIRTLRKKKKMTQEQLAKQSGMSRHAIINFETGKRSPRLKDFKKITDVLGISFVLSEGGEK